MPDSIDPSSVGDSVDSWKTFYKDAKTPTPTLLRWLRDIEEEFNLRLNSYKKISDLARRSAEYTAVEELLIERGVDLSEQTRLN